MDIIFALYIFIGLLVSICFIVIIILPLWRLNLLKKQLNLLKAIYYEHIVDPKTNISSVDALIEKNEAIAAEFKKILPEGETLGSIFKEVISLKFQKYQDLLLEIERKSDFEPRFWWPKKYCIRLHNYKQEIRVIINKIRNI